MPNRFIFPDYQPGVHLLSLKFLVGSSRFKFNLLNTCSYLLDAPAGFSEFKVRGSRFKVHSRLALSANSSQTPTPSPLPTCPPVCARCPGGRGRGRRRCQRPARRFPGASKRKDLPEG